jgi:hypothetical protein
VALAAFDEFMLGSKDRRIPAPEWLADHSTAGGNGIFQPKMMSQGHVVGTWQRMKTKREVGYGQRR